MMRKSIYSLFLKKGRTVDTRKYSTLLFTFILLPMLVVVAVFVRPPSEVDAQAPLYGNPEFYGINAENRDGTDPFNPNLEQWFQMISASGATSVRINFPWEKIQPLNRQQAYLWGENAGESGMDKMVMMAKRYNLKVVAVLVGAPSWAVDPNIVAANPTTYREYPPLDRSTGLFAPQFFADFARDTVKRYKPYGDLSVEQQWGSGDNWGITDWQIGNEINATPSLYGVGWGGTMEQYAQLLNLSYASVHAECGAFPSCNVISGGVADRAGSAQYPNLYPYLWEAVSWLYLCTNNTSAGYFDTLDVHTYQWRAYSKYHYYTDASGSHPYDYRWYEFPDPQWYRDRLSKVSEQMSLHGDSGKKIWVGETGYRGKTGCVNTTVTDILPFDLGCLSEDGQKDALNMAYQISAEYPQVEKVFWWQSYATSYTGDLDTISLSLIPKPAYAAFAKATGKVYGAIGSKYISLVVSNPPPVTQDSVPGSPASDEYDVTGGRAQNFTNGRIYWNSTTYGTYWLRGAILGLYDQGGAVDSEFGFPTSDQYAYESGFRQDFENGYIIVNSAGIPMGFISGQEVGLSASHYYWGSYADYTQQLLSRDYTFSNAVEAPLRIILNSASCTGSVILSSPSPLPYTVADSLNVGASMTFGAKFRVPTGTSSFRANLDFSYYPLTSGTSTPYAYGIAASDTVAVPGSSGTSAPQDSSVLTTVELDTAPPVIGGIAPSATIQAVSTTISMSYSDPAPSAGINPESLVVTLDGSVVSGCTASDAAASCAVSGLAMGAHNVGVSVSDNAGNISEASGVFEVSDDNFTLTSFTADAGQGDWYYTPEGQLAVDSLSAAAVTVSSGTGGFIPGANQNIEMDITAASSSGTAGFHFRRADGSAGNNQHLGIFLMPNQVKIHRMGFTGAHDTISDETFTREIGRTYHVKMVQAGQNIKVYVDGQLFLDDNDPQNLNFAAGGRVAPRCVSASCRYDNVRASSFTADAGQGDWYYTPEGQLAVDSLSAAAVTVSSGTGGFIPGANQNIEMDITAASSSGTAGFHFRRADGSAGNNQHLGIFLMPNQVKIHRMGFTGAHDTISDETFTREIGRTYHVKMVQAGQNIKVYVDGQLFLDDNDPQNLNFAAGGRVAPRCVSASCRYDNVRAWGQ